MRKRLNENSSSMEEDRHLLLSLGSNERKTDRRRWQAQSAEARMAAVAEAPARLEHAAQA